MSPPDSASNNVKKGVLFQTVCLEDYIYGISKNYSVLFFVSFSSTKTVFCLPGFILATNNPAYTQLALNIFVELNLIGLNRWSGK